MSLWDKVTLGSSGLLTSRLGIASSFGVGAADVEYAFDRGINYFYWGSLRRADFGRGITTIAKKHRSDIIVVIQSYSRVASLMPWSLHLALRRLKIEYADFLLLGWWNDIPSRRILDKAIALREQGKVRHLMISCHHRPSFEAFAQSNQFGAVMVRYNAAHPGAEQEVFPAYSQMVNPPGVIAYTATRWGSLLNPSLIPSGELPPRASDCYRFCLSHPSVQVTLTGPKNRAELDEALVALDKGSLSSEELERMKRVGHAVREHFQSKASPMAFIDRLAPKPKAKSLHRSSST